MGNFFFLLWWKHGHQKYKRKNFATEWRNSGTKYACLSSHIKLNQSNNNNKKKMKLSKSLHWNRSIYKCFFFRPITFNHIYEYFSYLFFPFFLFFAEITFRLWFCFVFVQKENITIAMFVIIRYIFKCQSVYSWHDRYYKKKDPKRIQLNSAITFRLTSWVFHILLMFKRKYTRTWLTIFFSDFLL